MLCPNGQLPEAAVFEHYRACRLCPRKCGADRLHGKTGFCGETADLRLGLAALHLWEEPCLSGPHGAGAVFFSGCSLRCVYCQNAPLSRGEQGLVISAERLAEIFLSLEAQGASCIDLVTPDHFLPHIVYALKKARLAGLSVPAVYNCSGYETPSSLSLLDGIADIYLTDFKYADSSLSGKYSSAPDYPENAFRAVEEMVRQQPDPIFSEDGMQMKKGVLVRHLVLPGHTRDSMEVIRQLYERFGSRIWFSIMSQFTPQPSLADSAPELNRSLTRREYDKVVDYALSLGITNAFIQEGGTASDSFIPLFDGTGVRADPQLPQTRKA